MNDVEQAAISARLKKAEELITKRADVIKLLNEVQGTTEVTEADAVADRVLGKKRRGEIIYSLKIGLAGYGTEIKWDDRMRPAFAKMLREYARALQAEYEAL